MKFAKKFLMKEISLNLLQQSDMKMFMLFMPSRFIFEQSRQSRTIDLSTANSILFNSPRDIQKIEYLGTQLKNAIFLRHAYQLAKKEDFGHLLIDLDAKTSECLRVL